MPYYFKLVIYKTKCYVDECKGMFNFTMFRQNVYLVDQLLTRSQHDKNTWQLCDNVCVLRIFLLTYLCSFMIFFSFFLVFCSPPRCALTYNRFFSLLVVSKSFETERRALPSLNYPPTYIASITQFSDRQFYISHNRTCNYKCHARLH